MKKICKSHTLRVITSLFVIAICILTTVNGYWIDDVKAASYTARDGFYSMSDSSVNRMSSEHFQIIWGNNDTTGTVNDALVRGNLANLEMIRNFYLNVLNMDDPGQSHSPNVYGYGYYKTNLYIANTGLSRIDDDWAYMSVDSNDFGYMVMDPGALRVDPPSWVVPHEYSHVITYHQGGVVPDGWYEAVANWFRDQYLGSTYYAYGNSVYGPTSDFFAPLITNSDYYFPHLKNWYDAWPILLYIHENPDNISGLGNDLMKRIISDRTYDSNMMTRIQRLSGVSIKTILAGYSKRMVTMDYSRQSSYLNYLNETLRDSSNYNRIYTTLNQSNGWLVVDSNRAPMQGGYNIVPLNVDLSAGQVTVNFQGTSTASGADYRATIVSKTANNVTRYSSSWSGGQNSLSLQGNETKVYLVVCATPNTFGNLEIYNENAVGTRYPYKIQVSTGGGYVVTPTPTPTQPSGGSTNLSWNFSDSSLSGLGTISSSVTINGLSINATSAKPVKVKSSSGSYYLALSGAGNVNYRSLGFNVNGSCTISIKAASSNTDTRNLAILDQNGNQITTLSYNNTVTTRTYQYNGSAQKLYICSTNSGINVYSLSAN